METIATRLAERSEKLEQVSFYGWPVVAFLAFTALFMIYIKRQYRLSLKNTFLVLVGWKRINGGVFEILAIFTGLFAILIFQVWLLQNCKEPQTVSSDFPALCWR
jgi:hypothetical protein